MVSRCDLTELKSLSNPPVLVVTVLWDTLKLLGFQKRETEKWKTIKFTMANIESFLARCKEADKDKIPEEVQAEVRETVKNVSVEKIKSVSSAAANVYLWNKSLVE